MSPPYPFPMINARSAPHMHPSSGGIAEMVERRRAESAARLRNTLSGSSLSSEAQHQCSIFANYLRIYKHLFTHTYVHVVLCGHRRSAEQLISQVTSWKGWNDVRQLASHALISKTLRGFWEGVPCRHQHNFSRVPIPDDDSDLLCLLLSCDKNRELYTLSNEDESQRVAELLWQFLMQHQRDDVVRRLRSCIYRMARKSAYIPRALWIDRSSISYERKFGASGNVVMKTKMAGKDVFIKKLLCDDRGAYTKCLQAFASEVILWKTLHHRNIVPFLGVLEEGSTISLVSPFFVNGSIRDYMKRSNPRHRPSLAKRWAKGLTAALAYIHSHAPPIVHGDLKGDNVLVDDDGHACLTDFGQSYASDSARYLDSSRVGSPSYGPWHWMAPEVMTGGDDAKITCESDVYSLGCVLYEMVSGSIPFAGLSAKEVVMRVPRGERPDRPPSVSRDDPLWDVVKMCWKTDPRERPSSARLASLLH